MSRIIVSDEGYQWVFSYKGEIKWIGAVTGQMDIEVVGPIDSATRGGIPILTTETTGMHYDYGDQILTLFPAYDSFEAFQAAFHWVAYTFLLLFALSIVQKFLVNRNPSP